MWTESLQWRIIEMPEKPGWFYMAFEGATEAPGVRDLDKGERSAYLDSVVSVSAVDRDRDETEIPDGCDRSPEGLLLF